MSKEEIAVNPSSEVTLSFCQSFPKIDLHAHLSGSIRKSTLLELVPEEDKPLITEFYSTMNYDIAFKFFSLSSKILTKLSTISRITREMTEDWNKENVAYLEIRTTLKNGTDYTKVDYLKAVLEEIKIANEKYNMITRLILSLNREKKLEEFNELLNIYKSFDNEELKKLIVGIDYCGYEANEKSTYEEVIPVFSEFRREGLKVTIHLGEIKECKMFPFEKFVPDRVSHCHFLSEANYKEFMKRKVPVEICPTSSLITCKCKDYSEIPMKKFYKQKVGEYVYDRVCLCTDDVMLFDSDISQEYFKVAKAFGMSKQEIKELVKNGIDFTFEKDEKVKQLLKEKIEKFQI